MTLGDVQYRSWHGALGLIFIIGAIGFNAYFHSLQVDAAMRLAIVQSLQREYSGPSATSATAVDAQTPSHREPDIELRSVAAHGKWGALTAVVRVDFRVDGAAPAHGAGVRYMRVYHNRPERSWQVIGETGGWAYYSMWLP